MKFEILLDILITLLNKKQISARELANKYNLSTRTIYRYITYLDLCNIPICSKPGKNGGISIMNTYKLNSMFFSNYEKIVLIEAVKSYNIDEGMKENLIQKLNLINFSSANKI